MATGYDLQLDGVLSNIYADEKISDSSTEHNQSKADAPFSIRVSSFADKVSLSVQTFNKVNSSMNAYNPGSAAPLTGTPPLTSGDAGDSSNAEMPVTTVGSGFSKEYANMIVPSSPSSVIQKSNSQNVGISSQPARHAGGATISLIRPVVQAHDSATTLRGNSNLGSSLGVSVADLPASSTPITVTQSVSTGGEHAIKAEAPTATAQTTVQAVTPSGISASRTPTPTSVTLAASPGGIRAVTPQALAPRLPQSSPGQVNVQNIQLPPGMVLVRSESGQLLMIHQQALAQMQAQAQSQSQGALAPRPAAPANTPGTNNITAQAPGTTVFTRQVAPGTMIKQGSPAVSSGGTTTLQRPPVLQSTMGVALPGSTPREVIPTPGTTAALATETMENVKKCKNFLSTLIKLASSGKQSSETAGNVKQLVKDLLEGKLEAEDFTSKLYSELNSSPQPYLVPFLKRSLPALRQLTPNSEAFIQQGHLPQPASGLISSTATSTVVLGSPSPGLSAPATRPQLQPIISKQPVPLVLQCPQQGIMGRPQVTLATTPMVALRGQTPGRIVLGQPRLHHVQQMQKASMGNPGLPFGSKFVPGAALSPAQRNKIKEAGGSFRDDDDINDVASMAGVNLSEENARILATNSEVIGAVTRSCRDEVFLFSPTLQRRLMEIGRKFGVTEMGPEVMTLVSHATQQRVRNLLEKVSEVTQQRNVNFKEDSHYEQSSDVRAQLKFFEQLDQMEKQKKEEQEREILMKAAKSRARQEDPEQLRLKQKAKEMRLQEQFQMRQREANLTALAAIGPRKKRKSPSSASGAEGPGSSPSVSSSPVSSGSRVGRHRITRVNLRDLLFCLENEKSASPSHLLYKGFLK